MQLISAILTVVVLMVAASSTVAQTVTVDRDTIWVEAGTVIWDRPGPHGTEVARVQTRAELAVVDVTAGWVRVVYLDRSGWIEQPDAAASAGEFSTSPCASIELRADARCVDLGWVWLMTDLSAVESVEIERLLTALPERYRRRFGEFSLSQSHAWFAVLRHRADYEEFLRQYRSQLAVDASAVASGRVAAMLADPKPAAAASVLTHEGIHLLNRVALGAGVRVWLEEGTGGCFDLLADDGEVRGETLFSPILVYHQGGWSEEQTQVEHAGPRGALARLQQGDRGVVGEISEVLESDRRSFYRREDRERHYELSSILTCYLAHVRFPAPTGGIVEAYSNGALDVGRADPTELAVALAEWADALLTGFEESASGD